jgi:hypothetical protein
LDTIDIHTAPKKDILPKQKEKHRQAMLLFLFLNSSKRFKKLGSREVSSDEIPVD